MVGWICSAYIKNLRVINAAKDAQLEVLETNLCMLRDRAEELERRTPDHIEKVLAERIQIREEELLRLREGRGRHENEIQTLNGELATLKVERDKMRAVILKVKGNSGGTQLSQRL